jgi:ribonuclease G
MQSAFVDIGLERDAFLYVSDFYEDQEEYDKVFEEAEARATKFTTQQAEVPAVPAPPAAPVVTEAPPPAVAEVAPPPSALPVASPEAPPSVESPAATVAPPTPFVAPPAPGDSHDRRPFDQRRGRRRRHRGRPEFGEGRHGDRDRRFPPPYRAEEPPAESHTFEILPGESLAKYSHATSAPPEETESESGLPENTMPEVRQDALPLAKGPSQDKISEEDDDFASANSPVAQAYEQSAEASSANEPAAEVSDAEPAAAVEASAQVPTAAISAVVAEPTAPFAPGAIESISSSGPTESARAEVPAEPAPVEPAVSAPVSSAAEPEPAAEIPASPSSPSFPAEVAASYSVEGIAGPSSGEPEPKQVVVGA